MYLSLISWFLWSYSCSTVSVLTHTWLFNIRVWMFLLKLNPKKYFGRRKLFCFYFLWWFHITVTMVTVVICLYKNNMCYVRFSNASLKYVILCISVNYSSEEKTLSTEGIPITIIVFLIIILAGIGIYVSKYTLLLKSYTVPLI